MNKMEKLLLSREELRKVVKGSTKHLGAITLPKGSYKVTGLEIAKVEIADRDGVMVPRQFVNVHLSSPVKSGVVAASRFANAGYSTVPVIGRVKKKWYFPTIGIDSCYEGDLADLCFEIQGKTIEIEPVEGKSPQFQLGSWATKEEATKAGKDWSTKNFLRITRIASEVETVPAV